MKKLFSLLLLFATITVAEFPIAIDVTRKFDFSYGFTVKDISLDARRISIWVPLPQSDKLQTIENLKIDCPYPYSIEKDPVYENLVLKIETRNQNTGELSLKFNFQASRTPFKYSDEGTIHVSLSKDERKRFLSADKLIPIDGKIASEAKKVTREEMSDIQKARAIYDYIISTMKYDKSGKGWGRGDAMYACDVKRGNCTDFHSLFIGLARASGVPARFVMGFPLPADKTQGEISGYHCWAEFYADGIGWIPIDASEAVKNPEKKEFFFGGLDENRIQFSIGRDIRLDGSNVVEPVNYFIFPFVLVDGKRFENVQHNITFSETIKK